MKGDNQQDALQINFEQGRLCGAEWMYGEVFVMASSHPCHMEHLRSSSSTRSNSLQYNFGVLLV
uniref:Uncharacterized protein n=1 Tax=Triticum urartu TaxID=4572 RepID=A0A8R7UWF4_TRIUA